MKKICLSLAGCFVAASLIAANVGVSYTGPSGQGDTIFKATATGVTNMTMGTGGVYNVTLDPRYPITGVGILNPGSIVLAPYKVIIGGASGVGAAQTLSGLVTNDASGKVCATSTGLAWTNGTASGTLTPLAVTNATVGGAVLSGVTTVLTNVTAASTNMTAVVPVTTTNMLASLTKTTTNMTAVVPVTPTNILAGVTINNTTSNMLAGVTITLQYSGTLYDSTGAALTNANGVEVSIITNATLTENKSAILADASLSENKSEIGSAGTPILSSVLGDVTENTSSIGSAGTPILSAISGTLTLETGTPAVSSPTIALETVASGAVTVTLVPATGTFVKP